MSEISQDQNSSNVPDIQYNGILVTPMMAR